MSQIPFDKYIAHYFDKKPFWCFLALSAFVLIILHLLIFIYTKLASLSYVEEDRAVFMNDKLHSFTERFYELVFSGCSILFFMASYYLTDRFLDIDEYVAIWNRYNDFILLFLMILSCIFNSFLDRIFVRLRHLTRQERASVKLTGMLYMILIFAYIKFIYEDNNYDLFITYFLGLMIGRFVYFDASFKDFISTVLGAVKNIPILIMTLSYTAILAWYGFKTEYLLKHNGVITNLFFAHLFMCVVIFVIYQLRIVDLIIGKPRKKRSKDSENEL